MSKKNTNNEFVWDEDLCKQCDVCQKVCPTDGLKLVDGVLTRDQKKCNLCGLCALYCPEKGIEVNKPKKQ